MNLKKRSIGVGEAVRLAFGSLEREYVPSEILHENRVIHSLLGADGEEELEYEFAGWTLRGIPDKVLDDKVVELKVQRPLSKPDELLQQAVYQAGLYAHGLGLEKIEVWIYVYSTQEVKQHPYTLEEINFSSFLNVLEANLKALEGLGKFRPPALKREDVNKLALRMVKHE